MTKEQHKEIVDGLVEFVKRVASGKNALPEEIAVLPKIVSVLCEEMSRFTT